MPRMKLILNPVADRGRAADVGKALQVVLRERAEVESHNGKHYDLDWVLTEHTGHATQLARKAAEEGFDIVVAVGGDGTVNEVVNGLLQVDSKRRPKLGAIPIGSGNDFTHNVGIPDKAAEAIHGLFSEKTRKVDAGTIKDHTNNREMFWDNTIGIGFGGAVNSAAKQWPGLYGFVMYLVAVIQTIVFKPPALEASIQYDDNPPVQRSIAMLSICNGPREGGGFPVAPNAVMDDGLISWVIMRKMGRLPMFYFVPVVMSAGHLAYKSYFSEGTAKHIRVQTDKEMVIHVDGELFCPYDQDVHDVEVTFMPGALEVLVGG